MKKHQTVDFHIKAGWLAISRMYNSQAQKYDMTMAIGYVLLNIDNEMGTPATKIAPLLGLEPRSLTRMLKSLEDKGWIRREGDKLDKRYVNIFLTESGKQKREIARKTVISFNDAVRKQIPGEKLKIFFEVMQDINRLVESKSLSEKIVIRELENVL